jgi:hypothetical protein
VTVVAAAPVMIGWNAWYTRGTNVMSVVNGNFLFDAWVINASDTSLTYFVNGVAGGTTSTGTITSNGFYTAPSTIPVPATVTIVAVANADPTKSTSATMTIVPAPVPLLYLVDWKGFIFPPCYEAYIGIGQWFNLYAYAKNTGTNTIRFKVSGVAGGSAALGTIDSSGLFKAPTSIPPGGLVYVTASLGDDSNTQALLRLHVQ